MIKKLIITVAIAGLSVYSYGQGVVAFGTGASGSNPSTNPSSVARVTDLSTGLPVFGSNYYAQLFAADGAGAAESSLTAKGVAVNFKGVATSSGTAGYVQTSGTSLGANGSVVVPTGGQIQVTAQNSGQVTLQIRAWSSSFTTYDNALLGNGFTGKSVAFNFTPAYGTDTATDFVVSNVTTAGKNPGYTGIAGFTVSGVPEPSTIALGVMGLSALLFRRRK